MFDSSSTTTATLSRIYCGLSKPDGGTVSYAEQQQFIREVVASAFPDGFTVTQAQGSWRDTSTGEIINEPTFIVEITHESVDSDRVIKIAKEYKAQFGQQAVMVSTTPVRNTFV